MLLLRSSRSSRPAIQLLQLNAKRRVSSLRSTTPVPLSYDKYPAQTRATGKAPLLIAHGLFGSKQNWRSLGKALSSRLGRDVYALDLRNHGDSPHTEEHTYEAMAGDVLNFISEHQLDNPVLIGHSMGGKVVMTTALHEPSIISKLVVVDIAPFSLPLSNDFATYVEAMRNIDSRSLKKQSEADKILAEYEKDISVRQFLLTNLKRQSDGVYRFRIPYETLGKALGKVGRFDAAGLQYNAPTLFIAGGKSSYGKPLATRSDEVKNMFPNSDLKVVEGAGHWVHAEKPEQFLNLVTQFVGQDSAAA
ncbi:hypothetical protein VTP01DRAFT_5689 [Rhizomucor pusillus]|uniref:uncharacterized protein n=1 Tax=Rhizomucor pusillus TaxID=4840 RepID=UPI003743E3E3